jgi:TRAP-type C4-dicarboxylate transport system permease small subunit
MSVWRSLARIEDVVAGLALAVFTSAILLGVIFRYVLNYPLSWTNEISLIAFSWLMFVGAAICARENGHVLIDLITASSNSAIHRWTEGLSALVSVVASLVLAWVSLRYTLGAAPMVTPVFRVTSAIYNAAAPVGFILIAVHMLVLLTRVLGGRELDGHSSEGVV